MDFGGGMFFVSSWISFKDCTKMALRVHETTDHFLLVKVNKKRNISSVFRGCYITGEVYILLGTFFHRTKPDEKAWMN